MRWMIDIFRWQVSQGRFFVHQYSGKLFWKAELCAMKSVLVSRVDWWRTFLTNREEIQQPFLQVDPCLGNDTWIEASNDSNVCLQALESGPVVEEPCPAEMADYDHVYYDDVTGASLPSELCEETM